MINTDNYKIVTPKVKPSWRTLRMIEPRSSKQERKALLQIAWYFKREFDYDFVQYDMDKDYDKKYQRAFLFTEEGSSEKHAAIGGCFFEYVKWTNVPHGWCLMWVWLHPFQRNKGYLKNIWPEFKKLFGDNFYIEPPVSSAMKGFLKSVDHKNLKEIQE